MAASMGIGGTSGGVPVRPWWSVPLRCSRSERLGVPVFRHVASLGDLALGVVGVVAVTFRRLAAGVGLLEWSSVYEE